MSAQHFDVVVIGAGPAGLEAAATVASAGLRVVAIDKMGPGGQLMNLGSLQGIAGLEPGATGPDFLAEIADRAMSAGADIAIDDVSALRADGDYLVEGLDSAYRATAVIVATGLTPGTTGLAEEVRFDGSGISHCAHCDAPLYAGKPVAVAGSDAWAVEEAIELAEHAAEVTLISAGALTAAAPRLDVLRASGNVKLIEGRIVAINGEDALSDIVVRGEQGDTLVAAKGLFLQVGRVPSRDFIGEDLVGSSGIFLAGDVLEDSGRTISEAIADGGKAGHNAVEWVRARRRS